MIRKLAQNVGKGLVAGLAGTAAMTVSSTLEAKLRGREFSSTPAEAAKKVLGITEFDSEEAKARFSNLVHWGFGTGSGVLHGVMRTFGLPPALATPAHGATIWGGAAVMLPTLSVAPPFWMWGRKEVAIDVFHHSVYAAATGLAYRAIDRRT